MQSKKIEFKDAYLQKILHSFKIKTEKQGKKLLQQIRQETKNFITNFLALNNREHLIHQFINYNKALKEKVQIQQKIKQKQNHSFSQSSSFASSSENNSDQENNNQEQDKSNSSFNPSKYSLKHKKLHLIKKSKKKKEQKENILLSSSVFSENYEKETYESEFKDFNEFQFHLPEQQLSLSDSNNTTITSQNSQKILKNQNTDPENHNNLSENQNKNSIENLKLVNQNSQDEINLQDMNSSKKSQNPEISYNTQQTDKINYKTQKQNNFQPEIQNEKAQPQTFGQYNLKQIMKFFRNDYNYSNFQLKNVIFFNFPWKLNKTKTTPQQRKKQLEEEEEKIKKENRKNSEQNQLNSLNSISSLDSQENNNNQNNNNYNKNNSNNSIKFKKSLKNQSQSPSSSSLKKFSNNNNINNKKNSQLSTELSLQMEEGKKFNSKLRKNFKNLSVKKSHHSQITKYNKSGQPKEQLVILKLKNLPASHEIFTEKFFQKHIDEKVYDFNIESDEDEEIMQKKNNITKLRLKVMKKEQKKDQLENSQEIPSNIKRYTYLFKDFEINNENFGGTENLVKQWSDIISSSSTESLSKDINQQQQSLQNSSNQESISLQSEESQQQIEETQEKIEDIQENQNQNDQEKQEQEQIIFENQQNTETLLNIKNQEKNQNQEQFQKKETIQNLNLNQQKEENNKKELNNEISKTNEEEKQGQNQDNEKIQTITEKIIFNKKYENKMEKKEEKNYFQSDLDEIEYPKTKKINQQSYNKKQIKKLNNSKEHLKKTGKSQEKQKIDKNFKESKQVENNTLQPIQNQKKNLYVENENNPQITQNDNQEQNAKKKENKSQIENKPKQFLQNILNNKTLKKNVQKDKSTNKNTSETKNVQSNSEKKKDNLLIMENKKEQLVKSMKAEEIHRLADELQIKQKELELEKEKKKNEKKIQTENSLLKSFFSNMNQFFIQKSKQNKENEKEKINKQTDEQQKQENYIEETKKNINQQENQDITSKTSKNIEKENEKEKEQEKKNQNQIIQENSSPINNDISQNQNQIQINQTQPKSQQQNQEQQQINSQTQNQNLDKEKIITKNLPQSPTNLQQKINHSPLISQQNTSNQTIINNQNTQQEKQIEKIQDQPKISDKKNNINNQNQQNLQKEEEEFKKTENFQPKNKFLQNFLGKKQKQTNNQDQNVDQKENQIQNSQIKQEINQNLNNNVQNTDISEQFSKQEQNQETAQKSDQTEPSQKQEARVQFHRKKSSENLLKSENLSQPERVDVVSSRKFNQNQNNQVGFHKYQVNNSLIINEVSAINESDNTVSNVSTDSLHSQKQSQHFDLESSKNSSISKKSPNIFTHFRLKQAFKDLIKQTPYAYFDLYLDDSHFENENQKNSQLQQQTVKELEIIKMDFINKKLELFVVDYLIDLLPQHQKDKNLLKNFTQLQNQFTIQNQLIIQSLKQTLIEYSQKSAKTQAKLQHFILDPTKNTLNPQKIFDKFEKSKLQIQKFLKQNTPENLQNLLYQALTKESQKTDFSSIAALLTQKQQQNTKLTNSQVQAEIKPYFSLLNLKIFVDNLYENQQNLENPQNFQNINQTYSQTQRQNLPEFQNYLQIPEILDQEIFPHTYQQYMDLKSSHLFKLALRNKLGQNPDFFNNLQNENDDINNYNDDLEDDENSPKNSENQLKINFQQNNIFHQNDTQTQTPNQELHEYMLKFLPQIPYSKSGKSPSQKNKFQDQQAQILPICLKLVQLLENWQNLQQQQNIQQQQNLQQQQQQNLQQQQNIKQQQQIKQKNIISALQEEFSDIHNIFRQNCQPYEIYLDLGLCVSHVKVMINRLKLNENQEIDLLWIPYLYQIKR
ncbi:hypothetical protein PPERSA_10968 [Pseudocohnilembus persalinus]|uniref:Uncharacterized protein n=1 Tax=Pseudocohnilembus persalinus TaxID=266149 RepID=A0A0V0QC96_PSEPJ|nr:hypothetical protein PPERSA_10968 [Pseudocohnilembus persalinus]|eukprot:KRW99849.1 hypothetical protein PPERSA_10968 [Pseudocohnilembus persalinus]